MPNGEAKRRQLVEREGLGANVEIRVVFMRHGEKDGKGQLTEAGRQQAVNFGANLQEADAIKGYASPIGRVIETINRVVDSAPKGKRLNLRIRRELNYPPLSIGFLQRFRQLESEGPDSATAWYLGFGHNKPDSKTPSPYEVAQGMAHILFTYYSMADRICSGSRVQIINGTHQGLPEALLREILIRNIDDRNVIGFQNLSEIGGALRPAEAMEFVIKTNEYGEKSMVLQFRDQVFDVNLEKIKELDQLYRERKVKTG